MGEVHLARPGRGFCSCWCVDVGLDVGSDVGLYVETMLAASSKLGAALAGLAASKGHPQIARLASSKLGCPQPRSLGVAMVLVEAPHGQACYEPV